MTKEDKHDRRKARHELQKQLARGAMRKFGLYSTVPQIRAQIRIAVDRYFSLQKNALESATVQELPTECLTTK